MTARHSARVLVISTVGLAGLAFFSCDKKGAKSDSSGAPSTATTTDTGTNTNVVVGTVAISTSELAMKIYPQGLNVTAFPETQLDPAKIGTVGITVDPPALALVDRELSRPFFLDPPTQLCQRKWMTDEDGVITLNPDYVPAASGPNSPVGSTDPLDPCAQTNAAPDLASGPNGQDKLLAEQEALSGKAANCLSDSALENLTKMPPPGGEGCYTYDYGIMKGQSCKKSAKEACMVSFSREVVNASSAKVEGGLGIMQALLCQANKDGVASKLPGPGESLDLTTNLQTAANGRPNAPTISMAKITRLADVGGNAVYRTTLSFSRNGQSTIFNLAHSPTAEDGTYSGVMWIQASGGPGGGQIKDGIDATSVRYSRTGSGASARMKMDVLHGTLAGTLKPFTAAGEVALPSTETLDNSSLGSIFRQTFDVNPETSEGKLAVWNNPGANFHESARGFLFDLSYDKTANQLVGCGVAGADNDSIRATLAAGTSLSPTRLYTPSMCQAGPGGPNDNVAIKVWKQCFKQSATGVYEIDTSKTASAAGFDFLVPSAAGLTPPDVSGIVSLGDVTK